MTYYGGKELASSFRTVRKNTLQIAEEIPEDKYSYRAAPDTRSVAEVLTHIALGSGFQEQIHAKEKRTTLVGFDFPARFQQMAAEEKKPRSKQEIIGLLRSEGDRFAGWLEGLDDKFLGESVALPPTAGQPSRTRFDMLLSVKEHEMHHRAQLMLVQRIIGIVPHLTRQRQAMFAQASAQKS